MSDQPPVPPAAPPPMPPPGTPPGPPSAPPPTPMPGAVPDPEVRSAEQKALIGLILGICNFVICGLLFIPALILGNQALAVLDRPGVASNSRGMAVAARVLGIIGIFWICLAVIGAILWFAFIAAMVAQGGSPSTFSTP